MMTTKTALAIIPITLLLTACNIDAPPAQSAQQQAQQKADAHAVYVPKNDVEFKNYNARQQIADDPSTILWCTASFPVPSSPLFTVPIVGKLTSGTKRPYSTSQVQNSYQNSTTYSPELPGPDGMFGPSEEYRYGFTPTGAYIDFTGLQTFCTTEPTVFQRQSTAIVMQVDTGLQDAAKQAQAALQAGDKAKAVQSLQTAIGAGH